MTVDEFWQLIEATAVIDPYRHGERLVERLSPRPPDEILDFDYWWVQARNDAHTATMVSASYLICGDSLGDDGFEYFTGWLTLRGRRTFTRAIADPDSLAEFDFDKVAGSLSFEGYPAHDAWFAVHGLSSRDASLEEARSRLDAFSAAATARHGEYFGLPHSYYDEPLWYNDAEQLRARLPALSARFPDSLPPSPQASTVG